MCTALYNFAHVIDARTNVCIKNLNVNSENYSNTLLAQLTLLIMSKIKFLKGYNQVQRKDLVAVRTEIMAALGITTRGTFYARMRGKPEPKVSEAQAIEAIFHRYNITDIWGE